MNIKSTTDNTSAKIAGYINHSVSTVVADNLAKNAPINGPSINPTEKAIPTNA